MCSCQNNEPKSDQASDTTTYIPEVQRPEDMSNKTTRQQSAKTTHRKFSRKTDPKSSGNKRHKPPTNTHTPKKKGGKTFTDGNPLNSMLAKHNG